MFTAATDVCLSRVPLPKLVQRQHVFTSLLRVDENILFEHQELTKAGKVSLDYIIQAGYL